MSRSAVYLRAGLTFAGLSATCLLAVNFVSDTYKVTQVLAVIAGMSTMGSFVSFQRFLESPKSRLAESTVTFNEEFLTTSIAQAFKPITEDRAPETLQLPPWELITDQLIGQDNAMALAKLRIDLEAELRRIAYFRKVDLPVRASAMQLARKLVDQKHLPAEMLEPFKDVITVCNRAIHGEGISDTLALSVVSVGNQLLDHLRLQ